MKERPILFSAPMIRALLDGSKAQTRRVVKPVRGYEHNNVCRPDMAAEPWDVWWHGQHETVGVMQACPYGQPGDRLRVRETFIAYGRWVTRFSAKKKRDEWHFIDMTVECDRRYQYAADNPDVPLANGRGGMPGWWTRPAIFMPRAVSRILLEIVSVRVERLNDCSEADARAEGAPGGHGSIPGYQYSATPCEHYRHIWESINGAGSWDANPWVWVVEFKRVTL